MSERPSLCVDLNSDLGEGFGDYRMADDVAMLEVITSANVACGFHAGDPEIMARTFALAKERNINVGAHPGYPDLWGFGRRVIPFGPGEIERLTAYQVGAAMGVSSYAGHPITYVKPHGALANLALVDAAVAQALVNAVKGVDPGLVFMSHAGGQAERMAREAGLFTCSEIFADRQYLDDGQLVPRNRPDAMIHDAEFAAQRMLGFVQAGAIVSISGKEIKVPVETICVHGDSPGALAMARRLRTVLEDNGIAIRPFAASPGRS